MRGNYWPTGTIATFAAGAFASLISLQISQCNLTDDAAEILAECPALARVRKLDLEQNLFTGRGVSGLLTSPYLAQVAFLGLAGNPASRLDSKRLAAAEPAGLRMLHAHGCRFLTADVRKLARCPRLSTLWYLDLDRNGLTTAAVRELVRGFGDWCPPIVWMTHNRIDDGGAALLSRWKAAAALSVLHLSFNEGITDAGVRTLLDSPHLANLDGFGVTTSDEELNSRMKARFRFHELTYL
jgi:hypothetical protein